jgi:nitrogen fixation NifU-like protein
MRDFMDMYREEILEHYRNPRNQGSLQKFNAKAHVANPLCGDSMDMELMVRKHEGKNIIEEIMFKSEGCAISTATASMLTEKVKGMTVENVQELGKNDILGLLRLDLMPNRLRCALLSLEVLQKALSVWASGKSK